MNSPLSRTASALTMFAAVIALTAATLPAATAHGTAGAPASAGQPTTPVLGAARVGDLTLDPAASAVLLKPVPARFSPNGDHRFDTSTLTYNLDVEATVTLTIERTNGGGIVRTPFELALQDAGSHQFRFDGKDADGKPLSSGAYVVVLVTTRTVNGGEVTERAERSLVVDVTAPRMSGLKASPITLYPFKDGYNDATTVSVDLRDQDMSTAYVAIRNAAKRTVKTLPLVAKAGMRQVTWLGRDSRGAVVAPGRYTYQVVGRDTIGNEQASLARTLIVSDKRLVRQTASRTVQPTATFTDRGWLGRCSTLTSPARSDWSGSIGYLSNSKRCAHPSEADMLAFTQHVVTLPPAVRYGTIRVDAFGASRSAGSGDGGLLFYQTSTGEVSNSQKVLGAGAAWYDGPTVNATSFVDGRTFTWGAGSWRGNYYDIKQFKVTYSYFQLQ